MRDSVLTRGISTIVSILLALEACYFIWLGYALERLFRGAQNVSASDLLPSAIWTNFATGAVLIILAGAYTTNFWKLKSWFELPAILAVLYGAWGTWSGYPLMSSFESAFEGDAVSLGVISGVGFMTLGVFGLLAGAGERSKRSTG